LQGGEVCGARRTDRGRHELQRRRRRSSWCVDFDRQGMRPQKRMRLNA
jgi:hypothetical protein